MGCIVSVGVVPGNFGIWARMLGVIFLQINDKTSDSFFIKVIFSRGWINVITLHNESKPFRNQSIIYLFIMLIFEVKHIKSSMYSLLKSVSCLSWTFHNEIWLAIFLMGRLHISCVSVLDSEQRLFAVR